MAMSKNSRTLSLIAMILLAGCSHAEMQSAAAGEVIVKFAEGQAVNDTIVKAFEDSAAEASIEKSVQSLSQELDIPFVYSRLTSGREVVVEIPAEQVYEILVARLRDSAEVNEVTIGKRSAGTVLQEIIVVLDHKHSKLHSDDDASTLAARLIGGNRYAVHCEVRAEGQLVIVPDFDGLLETLSKALDSRADIDYAQPNYQVRHYDKSR